MRQACLLLAALAAGILVFVPSLGAAVQAPSAAAAELAKKPRPKVKAKPKAKGRPKAATPLPPPPPPPPAPPAQPGDTREIPVPIGATGGVAFSGNNKFWQVKVNSFTPDATQQVL